MSTQIRSAWPQIVGQAWADEEFRRRLLENPSGVLSDLGVEVPSDHRIELLEDTPSQTHLVLPRKPEDLDLLASAGGPSFSTPLAADAESDAGFACTGGIACTGGACTGGFACTGGIACTGGACTGGVACTGDVCCTGVFACTSNPTE